MHNQFEKNIFDIFLLWKILIKVWCRPVMYKYPSVRRTITYSLHTRSKRQVRFLLRNIAVIRYVNSFRCRRVLGHHHKSEISILITASQDLNYISSNIWNSLSVTKDQWSPISILLSNTKKNDIIGNWCNSWCNRRCIPTKTLWIRNLLNIWNSYICPKRKDR